MTNLNSKFNDLTVAYRTKINKLNELRTALQTSRDCVVRLTDQEDLAIKSSLFLQSLSDQTRLQVLDKISGIVTEALQTVKDKNLVFTMQIVTKANQPTLEMGILDKLSGQTYDIITSFGGGICDIVSIVLRVALLTKWQPQLSRVVIMDEVGKFISVKDQEQFAEFIKKISEALSLQFIWISHSNVLTTQAHKIFEVTKNDGLSTAQEKAPKAFNEDAVLRGAWRRAFRLFPIKKEVLAEGTRRVPRFNQDGSRAKIDSKEHHCQVCNTWVKASVGGKNNIDVDHIIPVIDVEDTSGKVKDWNVYKARLICDKSNLQRICRPCHTIKTKGERDHRQALKDGQDLDALEEQIKYAKSIAQEQALKKKFARFLSNKKPAATRARAAKLKAFLINRLTKED